MNERKAIIFLNGQIPNFTAAKSVVNPDDWLIAVDGGLINMLRLGFQPSVVIGDMDSLTNEDISRLGSSGVRLISYPTEKDETDFELALFFVVEKESYRKIRVLGALGGRLDQTLGNLSLLALPILDHCDIRLDDGIQEVFLIRSRGIIDGKPGDILSLVPMFGAAHGVVTQDLKYPLHQETLCPERTRGISNVMLTSQATVQVEQGLLLCVHLRQ